MKVKLLRYYIHEKTKYYNYGDDDITIRHSICDGLSDWEEIDDDKLPNLQLFVSNFNSVKNGKYKYLLALESDITAKFAIDKQIADEKKKNEEFIATQAKYKEEREKKKLVALARKAEKDKKKLKELQEKYGDV